VALDQDDHATGLSITQEIDFHCELLKQEDDGIILMKMMFASLRVTSLDASQT